MLMRGERILLASIASILLASILMGTVKMREIGSIINWRSAGGEGKDLCAMMMVRESEGAARALKLT
jgi:hypothetical protein